VTVYVVRHGKMVPKHSLEQVLSEKKSEFPSPRVSRFETYESPVTGAPVSSDRQREVDLRDANAYDVRDIGPNHSFAKAKEARKAENAARQSQPEQLDFWR